MFAKSPKAEELAAGADSVEPLPAAPIPRQRSIITLSSQSNPASPSPPTAIDNNKLQDYSNVKLTNSFEERDVIASNTRSIAALAAARRNRAHLTSVNQDTPRHSYAFSDPHKLTASRLAYHDTKYGSTLTLNRHGYDDGMSTITDQQSIKDRNKYRKAPAVKKPPPMVFGSTNPHHRSRFYEPHTSKQVRNIKI